MINMIRASKLYGLDIYDTNGEMIGKVHDLILNLEAGEVVRLTTEPLHSRLPKEKLPEIIQKKSILYKRVVSAKDILIVNR